MEPHLLVEVSIKIIFFSINSFNIVTAITCTDLDMGSMMNVDGISYSSGPADSRPFGTVATVTCDTGFGVVGSATSTCTGDGTSTTGMFDLSTFTCDRE